MIELLQRWLTFNAQNIIPEVWYALAILWGALVLFSLTSVASLDVTGGKKVFWAMVIICLPLVGLFIYCIRSLAYADYHLIEFLSFRSRNTASKAAASTRGNR